MRAQETVSKDNIIVNIVLTNSGARSRREHISSVRNQTPITHARQTEEVKHGGHDRDWTLDVLSARTMDMASSAQMHMRGTCIRVRFVMAGNDGLCFPTTLRICMPDVFSYRDEQA